MDYSSSIHDPENPTGASPWGNSPQSSPRRTRTDFGANDNGEPPLFQSEVSHNGSTNGQDRGFDSGEAEYRRPTTASTADSRTDENEPLGSQQQQYEQPRQQSQQQYPTQDTPKHAADQAHGQQGQEQQQQQQQRRPPQPQYKLQAKITGLERTGRKDPILRFDVHVR